MIVEVKLRLCKSGHWRVSITKEFSPENGGGKVTYAEDGGINIHRALDVAREMVTVSPGTRLGALLKYVNATPAGWCVAKVRQRRRTWHL